MSDKIDSEVYSEADCEIIGGWNAGKGTGSWKGPESWGKSISFPIRSNRNLYDGQIHVSDERHIFSPTTDFDSSDGKVLVQQ